NHNDNNDDYFHNIPRLTDLKLEYYPIKSKIHASLSPSVPKSLSLHQLPVKGFLAPLTSRLQFLRIIRYLKESDGLVLSSGSRWMGSCSDFLFFTISPLLFLRAGAFSRLTRTGLQL